MTTELRESGTVDSEELKFRELECELEFIAKLLANDDASQERVAAAREMLGFSGEVCWQSVVEFMEKHPKEAEHILSDPVTHAICRRYDRRFGELFRLEQGLPRDLVDEFDADVHRHSTKVAEGVRLLTGEVNAHRIEDEKHLSLTDVEATVETHAISRVYRSPHDWMITESYSSRLDGIVVTSTVPTVDDVGHLVDDKRTQLGTVLKVGPAFQLKDPNAKR